MERVRKFIDEANDELTPKLHYAIESAKEKAAELGELTREEAEIIGEYVKRDLSDAGKYVADQGSEFADWFRFDVSLVEERLFDLLSQIVNDSQVELQALAERAQQENIWLANEITGPGTLECLSCGKIVHFHETTKIPKCSQCGHTRFHRGE